VPDAVDQVANPARAVAQAPLPQTPPHPDEPDGTHRRIEPVTVLLLLALFYGALGRYSAAKHLTPHIDEPASVLAAQMVAEKGLPIFPSGVPYFQGAFLSYLLAPFSWFDHGGINHLFSMRLIMVAIGVLTIFFTWKLATQVSGSAWIGAIAAVLVASDPISIKWSGLVRMYAPLELFAVLLLWVFASILMDGVTRKKLAIAVVVFWLGVFTHIATALIWPAIALAALAVYGRKLWRERIDLGFSIGLMAGAPVVLTALNSLLKRGGATPSAGGELPGVTFVGDHLLTFDALTKPAFSAWEELYMDSALAGTMPYIMVLLSALLIGILYFGRGADAASYRLRVGAGLILLAYWLPIIIVGIFTQEPQERYVIHIVPSGFVLVALALQQLAWRIREMRRAPSLPGWQRRVLVGATLLLVTIVALNQVSAAFGLQRGRILDPDYVAASNYVRDRMEPGDPVFSAMTPAPYLVFEGDEGLHFISGSPYSSRTSRYVRTNAEGESVDYWIGVPSVYLMNDLCNMLIQNPTAWIVIDNTRLYNPNFMGGQWAAVITGMTYLKYVDKSGMLVLRPVPAPGRNLDAVSICNQAAQMAAQGTNELNWSRPPLIFVP
jgi:4-amino-4-deoxy-L-arabinose transferase-like glycosyltransferase